MVYKLLTTSAVILLLITIKSSNCQHTTKNINESLSNTTDDSGESSACDKNPETLKELENELKKYETCVQPDEAKYLMHPLDCPKFKVIINCFKDHITSVGHCYTDLLASWNTTANVLQAAYEYLCNPNDKLMPELYRIGVIPCLKESELRKCGQSIISLLFNTTKYSEISKAFLALTYTSDSCSENENNTMCLINGFDQYCKENKSATGNIMRRLNDIINEHDGCSNALGRNDISISFNMLMLLFIAITCVKRFVTST